MMNCWPVFGLLSCSGPSLEESLSFPIVRLYGVFSHALVGEDMIWRPEMLELTVCGLSTVYSSLAMRPKAG